MPSRLLRGDERMGVQQKLEDARKRRQVLDSYIADLESQQSEGTARCSDMDDIMSWVNRVLAEDRERERRRYQELLEKKREGVLAPGEQAAWELLYEMAGR